MGHWEKISGDRQGSAIQGATHNFAHVQNDNGGFETNTNTSDQTTSDDNAKSVTRNTGDHLNNNTNCVDKTASNHSPFSADHVSNVTSGDGTKEGTSGENGDDQRLVRT